jgi:uncharacterized protein
MGSESYHEPIELISERTKNFHRGIVSLIEELEAVDWYQQRAEACSDPELRAVLLHHRDEEIEHAMMNLEWLRRSHEVFDRNARLYLFSSGPITEVEAAATGGPAELGSIERGGPAEDAANRAAGPQPDGGGSLGIGSLRSE